MYTCIDRALPLAELSRHACIAERSREFQAARLDSTGISTMTSAVSPASNSSMPVATSRQRCARSCHLARCEAERVDGERAIGFCTGDELPRDVGENCSVTTFGDGSYNCPALFFEPDPGSDDWRHAFDPGDSTTCTVNGDVLRRSATPLLC
eukprot:6214232-Pleurochrysis_carterae.AAC.1